MAGHWVSHLQGHRHFDKEKNAILMAHIEQLHINTHYVRLQRFHRES